MLEEVQIDLLELGGGNYEELTWIGDEKVVFLHSIFSRR